MSMVTLSPEKGARVSLASYEDEARRIIDIVKRDFTLPSGALFLERDETGKVFAHHIFPDLGDVAPFFLYFGERTFIERQAELYAQQLRGDFLVSEFATLGIRGLVKSYEYTDLILGLLSLWEHTGEEVHKELLDRTVAAASKAFRLSGKMRSFYLPALRLGIPIIDTRDATLIECFASIYRATKDAAYLDVARHIFDQLIATRFYRKHALFADYEPADALMRMLLGGNKKTSTATLCKNTTNALFGFLDLYKATHDPHVLVELRRAAHAVIEKASGKDGGIVERFTPGAPIGDAYLTASFPVLDFLCDLSVEVEGERSWALEKARHIADYWISQQGETGLFPLRPGRPEDFFDSETDMSVALYKLAELTSDDEYRKSADRCVDGLLRFHSPANYPLVVDVHTGAVLNGGQRTKFLCLFLKLLILKIEQENGKTVYENTALFELLKDR